LAGGSGVSISQLNFQPPYSLLFFNYRDFSRALLTLPPSYFFRNSNTAFLTMMFSPSRSRQNFRSIYLDCVQCFPGSKTVTFPRLRLRFLRKRPCHRRPRPHGIRESAVTWLSHSMGCLSHTRFSVAHLHIQGAAKINNQHLQSAAHAWLKVGVGWCFCKGDSGV